MLRTGRVARSWVAVAAVAAGGFGLVQLGSAGPSSGGAPKEQALAERDALAAYGRLPLAFVGNAGQYDERVRYSAQAGGASVAFTPSEALFSFAKGKKGHTLALRFVGANGFAEPSGTLRLPGKVNYLRGSDPAGWRTGLPTFREVVYRELWPGIDLAFRGAGGTLKYEFRVDPGADPGAIRLAYRGQNRLSLGRAGDLEIGTALGILRDQPPTSYQLISGSRVPVTSRYVVDQAAAAYGFALGRYDARRPLVIDPGLVYSTFLGGSGGDSAFGTGVDGLGNAYVTGRTTSADFPATPGAFDTTFNGSSDAFVTKLNSTGSALVYSTYLGGSGAEEGEGIAVDSAGNAYVTGRTTSPNFPTTPGAFDTTSNGADDVFVTKLNAAGSAPLAYSTLVGGSGQDQSFAIAVDPAGSAYVTGVTTSSNYPTTPGAFDTTYNGTFSDAFVTKLNPSGSAPLAYSTFLGGTGGDIGFGIAVDAGGRASVTGGTESVNFPTTPGAFDTSHNGNEDAFVTQLNSAGSAPLVFSTYLGGGGREQGHAIALDGTGSVHVTGRTDSTFPTTPGSFDTTQNGNFDAFITKLNGTGSMLAYSTYLGGSQNDGGAGIALDSGGNAYVAGETQSPNFPTTPGAYDTTHNGGPQDAYVTKLNPSGSSLLYSTYFGGGGFDTGTAIAVDAGASAYISGVTSGTIPTTPGAFDTTDNGGGDAFAAKFATAAMPSSLVLSPAADTNPVGSSHTVTATVTDAGGNAVAGVTVRFSATGANSASGTDVTDASGEATFTYTGTAAGTDTISAFADTDNNGVQDAGEPSDTATKVWTPGAPATLTLDPPADTNTVGETHCVTATVRDAFGNPVPGVVVRFSVPTALATAATPSSGSDVTDANGEASFCYSAALPGQDTIHAFADSDNDGAQDAGEPFAEATKTWTLPASTQFCEVTITEGGWIVAMNGDQASFGGNARVEADGSVQGEQNYQDQRPAQPGHVHSIELTATTCSDDLTSATIFGTATIDGAGSFVFRIDLTDQGEPGTSDSYGITLSDGYASGQQQLQGGNVQIHRI